MSGTLELERFRTNPTRPGCKFGLEWRPSHIDGKHGKRARRLYINVDLSVAIDVEVANESESKRNRCLLVPGWCYKCDHHSNFSPNITLCWRRSFSLNEKQMFQMMDENHIHKRCNRVLKHLKDTLYLERNPFQVTSYVIKTLVLRHEERYGILQHSRIDKCILSLLYDLVNCCRNGELPRFHVPDCNTFYGIGKRKLIATEKAIRLVIAAMRQIDENRIFRLSACNKITKHLRYDMKKFLDELRKEETFKVQQCLVNADCQKWFTCKTLQQQERTERERRPALGNLQHSGQAQSRHQLPTVLINAIKLWKKPL